MKNEDARGVEGILLKGLGGGTYFRVYKKDKDGNHLKPVEFTDYKIAHFDLSVTIDQSESASFYYPEDGSEPYLDYDPETLGLPK